MSDLEQLTQQLKQLIGTTYSENSSNDQRHEAIQTLQRLQEDPSTCPEGMLVQCCSQLWADGNEPLPSRCYAMTLLHQAVLCGRIQLSSIPLEQIGNMSGTAEYQQAPKIFIRATARLLGYAGSQLWPQPWANFLAQFCVDDLHCKPMFCAILEDFLIQVTERRGGGGPQSQQTGNAKRFLGDSSILERVSSCVVNALGKVLASIVANNSSGGGSNSTSDDFVASLLFNSLESIIPLLPGSGAIYHLNLDECFRFCLNTTADGGQPAGGLGQNSEYVCKGFSLMRTILGGGGNNNNSSFMKPDEERSVNLFNSFCAGAVLLVKHEAWGELHEVLTTLRESITCQEFYPVCSTAVLGLCASVLQCPSIIFAQLVCEMMVPPAPNQFQHHQQQSNNRQNRHQHQPRNNNSNNQNTNQQQTTTTNFVLASRLDPNTDIQSVLDVLFPLLGKNNVHPEKGGGGSGNPAAVEFSSLHFGTTDAFDQGFADFRKSAGTLLEWIGTNYPAGSLGYIHQLISRLPPPNSSDPKTPFGHVTQNSATFCHWNTTLFMVERLGKCFTTITSLNPVDTFACLMNEKKIDDATLAPVYMNLMSVFWRCSTLDHWQTSIETLFYYLTREHPEGSCARKGDGPNVDFDDVDLVAARKRGATLLIQGATDHGPTLFTKFSAFIEKIQSLLMQNKVLSTERGFLYETVATLSNGLNTDEQKTFLAPIFEPHLQQLSEVGKVISDPQGLVSLLIGTSHEQRTTRRTFGESISVIGALLRRCQPSPLLAELAGSIYSQFCQLLSSLHSLTPEMFPTEFASVLDLSFGEKEQFRGSQNRRSNHMDQVERVRGALKSIRLGVYQTIGTFPAFLKTANGDTKYFVDGILSVLEMSSKGGMHVHNMKQFTRECLVPLLKEFPEALQPALPHLGNYIESTARVLNDDEDNNQQQGSSRGQAISSADAEVLERQLSGYIREVEDLVKPVMSQLDSNILCGYVCCVLRSRIRVRSGIHFLLNAEKVLPDAQRCSLFAQSLQVVCMKVPNKKERESLLGMLADLYVNRFPNLAKALGSGADEGGGLGLDDSRIAALHQSLMMCRRVDEKRRKFFEFLEQAAHGNQPSGY